MYLLDTNVVSELRRPKPHGGVVAWLQATPDSSIYLSAVTIGELQAGVERTRANDATKASTIEQWVDEVANTFRIVPMDAPIFRVWAKLMHTRPDDLVEDAMIAATAIVRDLTVVTRNVRHFKRLSVRLFDPFAPLQRDSPLTPRRSASRWCSFSPRSSSSISVHRTAPTRTRRQSLRIVRAATAEPLDHRHPHAKLSREIFRRARTRAQSVSRARSSLSFRARRPIEEAISSPHASRGGHRSSRMRGYPFVARAHSDERRRPSRARRAVAAC